MDSYGGIGLRPVSLIARMRTSIGQWRRLSISTAGRACSRGANGGRLLECTISLMTAKPGTCGVRNRADLSAGVTRYLALAFLRPSACAAHRQSACAPRRSARASSWSWRRRLFGFGLGYYVGDKLPALASSVRACFSARYFGVYLGKNGINRHKSSITHNSAFAQLGGWILSSQGILVGAIPSGFPCLSF